MTEKKTGSDDPKYADSFESTGSRYEAGEEIGGSGSSYDDPGAWTVRKETVGPGWTTQAGAGSGPGWGSAPMYGSDSTPSGSGYGESARYEADAVGAAESAPVDPDYEPEEPDYSDPVSEEFSEDFSGDAEGAASAAADNAARDQSAQDQAGEVSSDRHGHLGHADSREGGATH